jgi:carbonic anhydrase
VKKLIRGIVEFRQKVRPGVRETFARLALGQSPDALLIACSDSRVVPNLFASTEPGDLFVIRNPANIISPCGADGRSVSDESEAAAIEFSTLILNVRDIIVCGHSECGAMRMLWEDQKNALAPHLHAWLRHAEGALREVREGARAPGTLAPHNQLSQVNVLRQMDHLRTYPIVRERLQAGRLRLHAWWFDIAEAEVLCYDEKARRFVVIDEAEAERLIARLEDGK